MLYLIKFISLEYKNLFKENNIKICLCTLGKKENKYCREYVEHYKRYGVDKIFIYDNNDINGENFTDVLYDYIKSDYVEILNYRGINKMQMKALNDCYNNNYQKYDWLIFYDMDEYIYLKNYTKIKYYLGEEKFKGCDLIHLNWVLHLDNNHIFYQNKSLKERFPKIKYEKNYSQIKSILRGHIPNLKILCLHVINHSLKACDGFGNIRPKIRMSTNCPDYKYYYIDHYFWKSTEEFINKLSRGDAFYGNHMKISENDISRYFRNNGVTLEKIKYINNRTRINASKVAEATFKNNSFNIIDIDKIRVN